MLPHDTILHSHHPFVLFSGDNDSCLLYIPSLCIIIYYLSINCYIFSQQNLHILLTAQSQTQFATETQMSLSSNMSFLKKKKENLDCSYLNI